MESRILNFLVFRYHLLPINSNNNQTKLFTNSLPTYDEIRENKNSYFKTILDDLAQSNNGFYPIQLNHQEDDYYLFKIAQKKTTNITKDFKKIKIENEPYVNVILNNDRGIQKIAISENIDAFSSPYVVKNILKKLFQNRLERFGLSIEIEPLFDSVIFWEYVGRHRDYITYIDFQFVKPNLANISKSLPEVFKNFTENVNSHESHICIKAPERGVLENINQKNPSINGLVEYSSNGAGSIKLKVRGIRKQLNTKERPLIFQIKEVDIEGAPEQVFKLYQSIVGE